MVTQMQLKVLFTGKSHGRPDFQKEKITTKSCLLRRYLFMFTLTWITEKELERVIENKGDEFPRKKNMEIQSGGEKMRNASGPARWKWAAVKNKSEHDHRKQNIG